MSVEQFVEQDKIAQMHRRKQASLQAPPLVFNAQPARQYSTEIATPVITVTGANATILPFAATHNFGETSKWTVALCNSLNVKFSSIPKAEDMFPVKPLTITPKMRQFLELVPYADNNCTGIDLYKSYLEKYKSLKHETLDELVRQIASSLAMYASRRIAKGTDVDGEEINLVQPEPSVDHLTGLLLNLFVAPGHCLINKPRFDLAFAIPDRQMSLVITSEPDWGIGNSVDDPALVTIASEAKYQVSCRAQATGEALLFSTANFLTHQEIRPLPVLQVRGNYIGALVGIFDKAYLQSFLQLQVPKSSGQAIQLQPNQNSLLGFNLLTQTGRTQAIDMLCRLTTVSTIDSSTLLESMEHVVKE